MDEHEQKAVELFLNQTDPTGKTDFWIGLSDIAREGRWVWMTSGKSAEYTNWRAGEPNNLNKTEHFGHIGQFSNQRKWHDTSNTISNPIRGLCQFVL
jgi:hypothetical protein